MINGQNGSVVKWWSSSYSEVILQFCIITVFHSDDYHRADLSISRCFLTKFINCLEMGFLCSTCKVQDAGRFPADEDFGEGWWSTPACSLVAAESDSWCTHPTALWAEEGLGWGWLIGVLLTLSVYCGIPHVKHFLLYLYITLILSPDVSNKWKGQVILCNFTDPVSLLVFLMHFSSVLLCNFVPKAKHSKVRYSRVCVHLR